MDRSEWIKKLRKLDDDILDMHLLITEAICDVPEPDMQRGLTPHEAVKPHIPSSESRPCRYCGEIGWHSLSCPMYDPEGI